MSDNKNNDKIDNKESGDVVTKAKSTTNVITTEEAVKKTSEDKETTIKEGEAAASSASSAALQEKVRQLVNQLAIWEAINSQSGGSSSASKVKDMSSHKFWN